MKKSVLIIFLLLVQVFCVFAQNKKGNKKPLSIADRSFEFGIAYLDVNLANSFLSTTDFLKEVIIIDLDKLADGFKFNLGINATPLYFLYKSKEGWGIGLSTGIDAIGVLNLSGNVLSINEAIKDNSDISGAVFSSAALNTYFNIEKVKVKFNPSMFYTLAYVTPPRNTPSSLIYTLDYSDGTVVCIDYAMRIYKGFALEDNRFSITSNPGLDFTVGFEYPLAKEIGLTDILPFLDFDLSLDLINISFIPSTLSDCTLIKGRIGRDEPIKLINKDDDDDDSFISSDDIFKGKKLVQVSRPFRMLVKADWRPLFGKKLLTVTPVIGFCHSNLYYKPVSLEAGLNACLNFGGWFLLKTGLNYTERMFVNNFGIFLNAKAFGVDIGVDLRSQVFSKIWSGAGLGVNFGLKFGW